MLPKLNLKKKAVKLRNQGFSYSEISTQIPVSTSTLSLWLRNIALTKVQKQRLFEKMVANRLLGSIVLKKRRIERMNHIIDKAEKQITPLSKKELFLLGSILYWAEGAKQKEHHPSARVCFSNSDPLMINLFLKWLISCLNIAKGDIHFEIYIHTTYKKSLSELAQYWANETGFPVSDFGTIYYKKNKVRSYRKNRGSGYNGVLRVIVKRSTDLNRQIVGWVKGIYLQCGVV